MILLIDEYDVPLDKAFDNGYYDDMITFMRIFLGEAFKTNNALKFAVLTGCLRVTKESIFTGVNNLKINGILGDHYYDEYFGFIDDEVKYMLEQYNLSSAHEQLGAWYNGYRFGQADVYCPWDIVSHVDTLIKNPQARPESYWINTSSNNMIKRFIDKADATTRHDIEHLIAGNYVDKTIQANITYTEIDESIDHLWSILFLTGYLTQEPTTQILPRNTLRLRIPNEEIREIFVEQIKKGFAEKLKGHRGEEDKKRLYHAFFQGDCETIKEIVRMYLRTSISYYDNHENYYHGLLTGLLMGGPWIVKSNQESGDGRCDILLFPEHEAIGIVIEVKVADTLEDIPAMCEAAMTQAHKRNYPDAFLASEISQVRLYGMAFCKKSCGVIGQQVTLT